MTGVQKLLWNATIPLKVGCFIWLCLYNSYNRILTWANLQKRGFCCPGVCTLCLEGDDHIEHLFGRCVFFQSIWDALRSRWHSLPEWECDSICGNLTAYLNLSSACCINAFYAPWEIWRARNGLLFGGTIPCVDLVVARIFSWSSHLSVTYSEKLLWWKNFTLIPSGFFTVPLRTTCVELVLSLNSPIHTFIKFISTLFVDRIPGLSWWPYGFFSGLPQHVICA